MEHRDKVNAIQFIRPGAEFVLRGDDLDWLDANQIEPTNEEIKAGFIAHQKAQITDAKAKDKARTALLERLGITAEEAALLLG
jgi:hypothetical protein